jgi:hypothetical protein
MLAYEFSMKKGFVLGLMQILLEFLQDSSDMPQ